HPRNKNPKNQHKVLHLVYFFHNVPLDSFDLIPSKDGELNNSISAFDASMILRYVVGLISLTPYQMIAADVTGNGSISALDASYILQYSVGLISQFPTGDDWRFIPSEFIIDEHNWFSAPDRIQYNPLNSDYINQNFKGIIYGDVTGNWSNMLEIAKPFIGEAIVQLGDPKFIGENEFVVPIDIDSDAEMLSAYFEITYCSQDIAFNKMEFIQQSGTCFADSKVDKENLKISIASSHPLSWKDGKIRLKFKMKDGGNEKKMTIKLNEVSLNEDHVKANIIDNQLLINPSKPYRLTLSQNYPNPFNSSTSITYQIPKSCHVRLKIYNTLGQVVNTLLDSYHESGIYHIQWNGKTHRIVV
ncbi:MAG: dockerin type I repeat-containing protein, partial [Candidatus Thorarchaeota archaeon]